MKKDNFNNLYQLSDERQVKEIFKLQSKDCNRCNDDLLQYLQNLTIKQIYYIQMLNSLPYRNVCATYNYIKTAYDTNILEKEILNEISAKKVIANDILKELKFCKNLKIETHNTKD